MVQIRNIFSYTTLVSVKNLIFIIPCKCADSHCFAFFNCVSAVIVHTPQVAQLISPPQL